MRPCDVYALTWEEYDALANYAERDVREQRRRANAARRR